MIIPEKTYTDNPFVDNIIYNAKYIAMNCTVKDDDEAADNETVESLRNGEILISSVEGTSTYDIYTSIPKEILEKYIEVNTNLNLFMEDDNNLLIYLNSLKQLERDKIIEGLNKTARHVYIDHYRIMLNYLSNIDPSWGEQKQELYNKCQNNLISCTDSELFDEIPKYTRKRIIKTYIPDVQDLDNISDNETNFTQYILSRPILIVEDSNLMTKIDYISKAMRDVFISHYKMMTEERAFVRASNEKLDTFVNIPKIYNKAMNNEIDFLSLKNYMPENEVKNIINTIFTEEIAIQHNLYNIGELYSYILSMDNDDIKKSYFNKLNRLSIDKYLENYRTYLDSNIYNRCFTNSIDFFELCNYIPKETKKMILNSQIEEYTNIQLYADNKTLLDKYLDTLNNGHTIKLNISKDMREWYPKHHIELNDYYRSFMGLPPIKDGYIYEDTLIHSYDEETGTFKEFGTKFIDKIMEVCKVFPELHWRQNLYEFNSYDINILNEYGILDEYISECGSSINSSRYRYIKYLGDNKLDIYTCRRAPRFQLIGTPPVIDDEALKKFIDIYSLNREYCIRNVFSEAHKLQSTYYNKFIITFILINTIIDMLADISSLIINREVFDARCVEWLFESYGVPFYGEIPLKYLKAMLKNLNMLLKYKSSVKNMIDICNLFGFSDIKIFNYYLFKEKIKDTETNQYLPTSRYNKLNYKLEDVYIKIKPNDFINRLNTDLSSNEIIVFSDNVYYNISNNEIIDIESNILDKYILYKDYNGIYYIKLLDYIKYYEQILLEYSVIDIDDGIDAIELEGGSKIYNIRARDLSNHKYIDEISSLNIDTGEVENFDIITIDPMKYYDILAIEIDGYDVWYYKDEVLTKYYEYLDKYTETINYIDDSGNKRTKRIIDNTKELYIKDPNYDDFILIKDLDYFTTINATLNPVTLKFIKVPEGELLVDYKENKNYIVDYDEVTLNDEGDTWDGGLDHTQLYNRICNYDFTAVKTKYISIEALTDLAEQSFQISYFYNMLFDNFYSEEDLDISIPYIKTNHQFKLLDIICYLFSLTYLYNGVNDNIMYSPTQILYIKNYDNSGDINNQNYKNKFNNKNIKIESFNLEADIDELNKTIYDKSGLELDKYEVGTYNGNTITVADFFSLNNSKYQINKTKNDITAIPYNQDIKIGYSIEIFLKYYKSYYNDYTHSYIYDNTTIEIFDSNNDNIYIMDDNYYITILDTEINEKINYTIFYKYSLINNKYEKDNTKAYIYNNGLFNILYNLNNIYILNSDNQCIFSAPCVYTKDSLGNYNIFSDNNFFNGNQLLFGNYWIYDSDNNKYYINKNYAYIKVTINGVDEYKSWADVINHQDIVIPENQCYIKHSDGHFINFTETDYFRILHLDENIENKVYDYYPEDLYIIVDYQTNDYEEIENGDIIYYKKLKNYYDENKWIYTDDLYIKLGDKYIIETELLYPDNCYYKDIDNSYKLIMDNLYKYNNINLEDDQKTNSIIVAQSNNEYNLYTRDTNDDFIFNNSIKRYIYNSNTEYITALSKNENTTYKDTKTMIVIFNKFINDNLNSTITEMYDAEKIDNIWDENDWFYEDINSSSISDIGISGENIWYYRDPSLNNNVLIDQNIPNGDVGCGFYIEQSSYIDNNYTMESGKRYYMSFDIQTNFTGKIQIYNNADNSMEYKSKIYNVYKGQDLHISQIFIANENNADIRFIIYDLDQYPINIGDYIIISNINFMVANSENFISTDILSFKDFEKLYKTNLEIYKYLTSAMIKESDINKYKIYKKMYDALMISDYNKEVFKLKDSSYAKTYTDFLETRDTILYSRLLKYKNMEESILTKEIADEVIEIIYILEQYLDINTNQYIYSKFPGISSINIQDYLVKIINWFKSWKVHLLGIGNKYKLSNKYKNFVSIKYNFHNDSEYNTIRNNIFIYDTIKINPLEDTDAQGVPYADKYDFGNMITQSYKDEVSIKDRIRIIDTTANIIEYKDSLKDLHIILSDNTDKVLVNGLDLYITSSNNQFTTNANQLIMSTSIAEEQKIIYGQFIDEINLYTNDYIDWRKILNE